MVSYVSYVIGVRFEMDTGHETGGWLCLMRRMPRADFSFHCRKIKVQVELQCSDVEGLKTSSGEILTVIRENEGRIVKYMIWRDVTLWLKFVREFCCSSSRIPFGTAVAVEMVVLKDTISLMTTRQQNFHPKVEHSDICFRASLGLLTVVTF